MRINTIQDAHNKIETYFKGDRVRFTGKVAILHGGLFGQATVLEGHGKGRTIDVAIGKAAAAPEKGGAHQGLRVLQNLDLRVMAKALGEQGAIELISALVSGKARTTEDALRLVEESELL